jgi:homocysteine S-methyltransferase
VLLQQNALPHLSGEISLTDGGLETTLVFLERVELPAFAAFPLVTHDQGRETLRRYFRPYLDIAATRHIGFVLDTPTWRANADWGETLGYSPKSLARINRDSVEFALELRSAYSGLAAPIVVNGVLGPRGDGYKVETRMSAIEAERYHHPQVEALRAGGADMVSAVTMTYPEEATGIARAAAANGMPVVISFTVETDGKLPSGDTLQEAIEAVDRASGTAPAYYMVNCAHPTHFESALAAGGPWLDRIRGLRANASTMSHAELDAATELDAGDPIDLGRRYRDLRQHLKGLCVVGGCCGTDHRHVTAICEACMSAS